MPERMLNANTLFLEVPSPHNGYQWACHGLGMVFYEKEEWRARWKMAWLQVASGREQDRPLNQALSP